ncbi:MAG: sugar transferase [Burkholderiales bacterium]|nr:sugar transferase [Burkholderiales bacterium]
MRDEIGASAAAVVPPQGHSPTSSMGYQPFDDDDGFGDTPHWIAQGKRRSTGPAFVAGPSERPRFDDTLPPNDFLKDLYREKRRVERSRSALSMVLYQLGDSRNVDILLEVLHNAKRETDIVGHVGGDRIAVLCPDTDEEGSRCFIQKIATRMDGHSVEVISATYPHELFDSLAKGTPTQPAFQPLLATDSSSTRRQPYPLKRTLDIVGALVALSLAWPLMLLTAAAIAVSSRGPIIFKQTRLGQGGIPFTFYKFRSMMMNVDDLIHRDFVTSLIKGAPEVDSNSAGYQLKQAAYKLAADPRITPVGRFIRKTSIDELPQLFNVLKGDMSLVGPRPPLPYEATQYQPWHLRRLLNLKPGITGLWQVDGRSRVTFNDMVRMDLRYIRDCSLSLDLKILLKTVLVVIRCDGAV